MDSTTARPRLLAIDDDPSLRTLIRATLGDTYEIEQRIDGRSGLTAAIGNPPDAILLDIGLPDRSGYEVGRALRAEDATRSVPIIYLSGLSELDDRLAAYEAGGDDFLAKPFDPVELTDKIEVTLRHAAERRQLAEEKAAAFAAVMTALSTTSEIGGVLDFLRRSFSCTDYVALADAIVETGAAWDLALAVQIRGASAGVSRNRHGFSSPLEAGVLANLADCGRLVSLGHRLAVSYPHVTIMVLDMPVDDADRCGRLRDDLAWLAEAADARVQALDNETAVRAQEQTLERLVARTGTALSDIDSRRQEQKAAAVIVLQDLAMEMERAFMGLNLTEEQEIALSESLRGGIDKVIGIFDQGLSTDRHLQAITTELAGAVHMPR